MTDTIEKQLLQEIRAVREEIKDMKQELPWWELPVLSTSRAMEYLGIEKPRTFYSRMKDWGVAQCGPQMWKRSRIDAALNRISRKTFISNTGRKSA